MKRKSLGISKKAVAAVGTALATIAAGSYLLVSSGKSDPTRLPAYTVKRVIDGDTFETTEKQRIRLSSAEAPELDLCGGLEAKKALERMILKKPVYLKVILTDPYRRLVSLVYVDGKFINEEMIRGGYSYISHTHTGFGGLFTNASTEAREQKLGIYGSSCTQNTNRKNPSCNIKGNVRTGKFYFTPDCTKYYNQTQLQLYLGDQWFCTEEEAQKAGFQKSSQCL